MSTTENTESNFRILTTDYTDITDGGKEFTTKEHKDHKEPLSAFFAFFCG